jgi:hypothetical protein
MYWYLLLLIDFLNAQRQNVYITKRAFSSLENSIQTPRKDPCRACLIEQFKMPLLQLRYSLSNFGAEGKFTKFYRCHGIVLPVSFYVAIDVCTVAPGIQPYKQIYGIILPTAKNYG